MTVEHARAEEPGQLPVRTPQQALRRRRLLEKLEPVGDLFASGSQPLLPVGVSEDRLPRRGGTA